MTPHRKRRQDMFAAWKKSYRWKSPEQKLCWEILDIPTSRNNSWMDGWEEFFLANIYTRIFFPLRNARSKKRNWGCLFWGRHFRGFLIWGPAMVDPWPRTEKWGSFVGIRIPLGSSRSLWWLGNPPQTEHFDHLNNRKASVAKANGRPAVDPWTRHDSYARPLAQTMNSCTLRIRCLGETTCYSAWSSFRSMSGDPIFPTVYIGGLGGGFKYFLFSPLFGEDFQLD